MSQTRDLELHMMSVHRKQQVLHMTQILVALAMGLIPLVVGFLVGLIVALFKRGYVAGRWGD